MNQKSYASFSTFSATGRVYHAELVKGKEGSEFLAVTLITNLQDGDDGVTITFNTTNGLMSLYKGDYLPTGRIVTVTGQVKSVGETYTNKAGEVVMLERPRIQLVQAFAHVGPMPASASGTKRAKGGTRVVRPSGANKRADDMLSQLTPAEIAEGEELLA